jgi:predicted amidohydrolase
MRTAIAQFACTPGDVADNLARIERAATEATADGADLLVLPELATTGYGAGDAITALAEPADGAQAQALTAIARRAGLALVCGFAEAADGAVYNAALAVTPAGVAACYRKRQLYAAYERGLFRPGEAPPPVLPLASLRVGLLVCYDVEFPELARHLALQGAELLAVPTALPAGEPSPFIAQRLVPVRAFENQLFVAYADHCGRDDRFGYAGLSCIAAPDGADLARAGPDGEALLTADLDPAAYAAARAANPYLVDRRPLDD